MDRSFCKVLNRPNQILCHNNKHWKPDKVMCLHSFCEPAQMPVILGHGMAKIQILNPKESLNRNISVEI